MYTFISFEELKSMEESIDRDSRHICVLMTIFKKKLAVKLCFWNMQSGNAEWLWTYELLLVLKS